MSARQVRLGFVCIDVCGGSAHSLHVAKSHQWFVHYSQRRPHPRLRTRFAAISLLQARSAGGAPIVPQQVFLSDFLLVTPPEVEAQCEYRSAPSRGRAPRLLSLRLLRSGTAPPQLIAAQQDRPTAADRSHPRLRPLLVADWSRFRAFDLINCAIPVLYFARTLTAWFTPALLTVYASVLTLKLVHAYLLLRAPDRCLRWRTAILWIERVVRTLISVRVVAYGTSGAGGGVGGRLALSCQPWPQLIIPCLRQPPPLPPPLTRTVRQKASSTRNGWIVPLSCTHRVCSCESCGGVNEGGGVDGRPRAVAVAHAHTHIGCQVPLRCAPLCAKLPPFPPPPQHIRLNSGFTIACWNSESTQPWPPPTLGSAYPPL